MAEVRPAYDWRAVQANPFRPRYERIERVPGGFGVRDGARTVGSDGWKASLPFLIAAVVLPLSFWGEWPIPPIMLCFLGMVLLVVYAPLLQTRTDFVFTRRGMFLIAWSDGALPKPREQAFVPWEKIHEILVFRSRKWVVFKFTLNIPEGVGFASCSLPEFEDRMIALRRDCAAAAGNNGSIEDVADIPLEIMFRLDYRSSPSLNRYPPLDFQPGWSRKDYLGVNRKVRRCIRRLEELSGGRVPVYDNTVHG